MEGYNFEPLQSEHNTAESFATINFFELIERLAGPRLLDLPPDIGGRPRSLFFVTLEEGDT